ncbi:hypothetical protein SH501x_002598 [Pirellulaceae bacterium SH501]
MQSSIGKSEGDDGVRLRSKNGWWSVCGMGSSPRATWRCESGIICELNPAPSHTNYSLYHDRDSVNE